MKEKNLLKNVSQVFVLPLKDIRIHPEVLSISKPKKMDHIEYTMEKYKQLMPVLGNLVDGTFYITDGVLRYEVAKKLGMPTLKCLDSGTIDKDVIRVRMTSNQRSKMSYMEMATYAEHTLGVIGKSQGKKRNSWLGMEAIEDDDNFGLAGKDRFQLTCHLLDLPIKAASLRKLMAVKWFEDENPGNNFGIMSGLEEGNYKIDKAYQLVVDFNFKKNEGFTEIDLYPIKTENYEVIHGSIEDIILPENMEIDAIFTSPVYYKLRRYGDDPNEMGWEKTPQLYAERLVDSLMTPYNRLKETGSMFVNLGETYDKGRCLAVIEHVVIEMVKRGMFYVDRIIWKKDANKPISNQNHRFQPSYEVVLHFAKSKNYYFDRFRVKKDDIDYKISRGCKDYGWDGVNYFVPNFYKQLRTVLSENELHDIVTVQTNSSRIKHVVGEHHHPATFSQMLPAIFLSTFCPKPTVDYKPLVFDPFLGGASCGRTALMMGYRFSGVELYEKNVETSKRILAESLKEFEPRALNQIEAEMVYELVA